MKLWAKAAPTNIPSTVITESDDPVPARTNCLNGQPPSNTAQKPTAKGIKAAAGGPGINGQIFVIISIIALFIVAFYGLKREKNR